MRSDATRPADRGDRSMSLAAPLLAEAQLGAMGEPRLREEVPEAPRERSRNGLAVRAPTSVPGVPGGSMEAARAERKPGGANGLAQDSFEGGAGRMLVLSRPACSRKPIENRFLKCPTAGAADIIPPNKPSLAKTSWRELFEHFRAEIGTQSLSPPSSDRSADASCLRIGARRTGTREKTFGALGSVGFVA